MLVRQIRLVPLLIRTFGFRGLARRLRFEVKRKSSLFLSAPRLSLNSVPEVSGLYASAINPDSADKATIVARGDRVVDGYYEAYGHDWRSFPNTADAWRDHPRENMCFPCQPWWRLPHITAAADIKDVWEPARFSWVYDLIRAYRVTGDSKYRQSFMHRLRDWQASCPPFKGPHWLCGQEVSIRALALLHALENLLDQENCVDERRFVNEILLESAERIADAIEYGLSQRNNHGISEGAGLVHLGLFFRGHVRSADRWVRTGLRLLNEQLADQFSSDGWYSQHSFNYSRVALTQALYAERALQVSGQGVSSQCLERLNAALDLFESMASAATGHVPNHGANDGAQVLPLSTAEFRDFRPLLTLAAVVLQRAIPADLAPDRCTLNWLGAEVSSKEARSENQLLIGNSGFALARYGQTMLFVRAGRYKHRPSHMDALHVHVFFDGKEVISDPGTFAYNGPPPWNNGLVAAAVHNGPIVDGQEFAEKGPRFLWLSWPIAEVSSATAEVWGYKLIVQRPNAARREISVYADKVLVTDSCSVKGAKSLQVNWLLHPSADNSVAVECSNAVEIVVQEGTLPGWYSEFYGSRVSGRLIRATQELCESKLIVKTEIRSMGGAL